MAMQGNDALDSLMNAFHVGPSRASGPSGQIVCGAAGFRSTLQSGGGTHNKCVADPVAGRRSHGGSHPSCAHTSVGAESGGLAVAPKAVASRSRHSGSHPAGTCGVRAGAANSAAARLSSRIHGGAAHAGHGANSAAHATRAPAAGGSASTICPQRPTVLSAQRIRRPSAPANAPPAPAAAVVTGPPIFGYAADQNSRWRPYMEDDYAAVQDLDGLPEGSLYCGLYDGHGGRTAVDFVTAHLHTAIGAEVRGSPLDCHDALCRAFLRVDRMLLQAGALQCGTTVSVCICFRRPGGAAELCTANVGDSRVVLVRGGGEPPQRLSVDHLPSNESEQQRVQKQGGVIIGGRVGGSLAVTRALGDHALKGPGGGVSGEPTCLTLQLRPEDRFVIMASDGLWDVVTEVQAQQMVLASAASPPADIARQLVQRAVQHGSRDNVSVLLIRL